MSNIKSAPFTAATNKFAYAQVFTRSTLPRHDDAASDRGGRRRVRLLHRDGRGAAGHAAAR